MRRERRGGTNGEKDEEDLNDRERWSGCVENAKGARRTNETGMERNQAAARRERGLGKGAWRAAKNRREEAGPDTAENRVKAMDPVDQAISEVQAGISAANAR